MQPEPDRRADRFPPGDSVPLNLLLPLLGLPLEKNREKESVTDGVPAGEGISLLGGSIRSILERPSQDAPFL